MRIETKKTNLIGLGLLLITFLVFIRVPSFDFVLLDDTSHIDHNPYFSPLTLANVRKVWAHPHMLYMPLSYSVWASAAYFSAKPNSETSPRTLTGVAKEFKFSPKLFHLCTLLFHLMCVWVLFHLLLLLFPSSKTACFLACLFFAIHPVQVEAVSWVSGLKDTLSGFLSISALFLILKSETKATTRFRSYLSFSGATIFFLGALLSKPSTLVLPLIALSFLVILRPLRNSRYINKCFFWAFLAFPFGLLVSQLQNPDTFSFTIPKFYSRVLLAFDSLSFYLSKVIFPLHLAPDYGRNNELLLQSGKLPLTSGLCIVFLTSMTYYFIHYKLWWPFFTQLCILLALLPVLGLQPFVFQTTSNVADRYLYLALMGLSLGLARFLSVNLKKTYVLPITVCLLVVLGTRSFFQTGIWKDSIHLFTHTLRVNPHSWLAHNNLGSAYEKMELYEQALYHYAESGRIKPQGICYNNIGAIQLSLKNYTEARDAYLAALKLNPISAVDYHGLGNAYRGLGELKTAETYFQKASSLSPQMLISQNALRQIRRELFSKNNKNRSNNHRKPN